MATLIQGLVIPLGFGGKLAFNSNTTWDFSNFKAFFDPDKAKIEKYFENNNERMGYKVFKKVKILGYLFVILWR